VIRRLPCAMITLVKHYLLADGVDPADVEWSGGASRRRKRIIPPS
jgi:hypothetical protein